MNIVERVAAIDKKFAWSFLGVVLAVLFGGLTLYNEFIKVRDAQIVVEVLSNNSVLDLKENVPELKILYGDVDIKSVEKDLSVIAVKIKNVGGGAVLGNYYDASSPFVIKLTAGELLKIETTTASNDYLAEFAVVSKASESSVVMPKVIMEPGESYTIKLLVLHGAHAATKIVTGGKVGGMLTIPVTTVDVGNQSETFLSKAFSGSSAIQVTRTLFYFIFFIALFLAVILPVIGISNFKEKMGRKKNVRLFKAYMKDLQPNDYEVFFECYVRYGLPVLESTVNMLEVPGMLEKLLLDGELHADAPLVKPQAGDFASYRSQKDTLIGQMVTRSGVIYRNDGGAVDVDREKEEVFKKFIEYAKIKDS